MRVFVDVGAHYGETARLALNPKWAFDQVFSMEPSAICRKRLSCIRDRRLTIVPAALSKRNGTGTLHGSGLLGGSLYADKRQHQQLEAETVKLLRATEWLRENVSEGSEIWLKMNCEGGEADILEDLLDSGELWRIHRIWIDFDIVKVPSQASRQEAIERRLKGIAYSVASRFEGGVEAWLGRFCPQVQPSFRERLAYSFPDSPYDAGVALLGSVLPRRAFWWLGHRYGRLKASR